MSQPPPVFRPAIGQPQLTEPKSGWRSVLMGVQIPALVLVPFLLPISHGLRGGGGWMSFIYLLGIGPAMLVLQAIILGMTTVRARRLSVFQVGRRAAWALLIYLIAMTISPLGLPDAGDAPGSESPSLFEAMGMDRDLAGGIGAAMLLVGAVSGVTALILAWVEMNRTRGGSPSPIYRFPSGARS